MLSYTVFRKQWKKTVYSNWYQNFGIISGWNEVANYIKQFIQSVGLAHFQKKKSKKKDQFSIDARPDAQASNNVSFTSIASVASEEFRYYAVFIIASSDVALNTNISYPLRFSWIYDAGAEGHVCKKTMLQRFRKIGDAFITIGVLIGEIRSNVEDIGVVDMTRDVSEGKKWKFTLQDVRYIPNFMTNVVDPWKFLPGVLR